MASLSERIRSAQATLKESEEKYRGLFTNARVGLFCTTIAEGRFLEANQTMADILGYDTPASLIRECLIMRCYVSPTERQSILDAALSTGEIQNVETQLFRRDRKRIWVRITGRILPEERCIEGVAVDITGIKRIQATLKRANDTMHGEHKKRKRLSRKLITTLEQSQQRLAMELHDQVGQELTTLKMDLELALKSPCQNFPDRLPCRDRMASARDKAAKTIQSIRAICSGLRPTVLEDLGLVSAISGLCEQIQAHSAIRIRFFTKNIPEHMDEEKALAVYRIAQEALTNIVRHSKANEAFVSLIRREEHLLLSIEDNGKGFERASPMGPSASPEGLGLLIMEERAVLLEGRFQQESHLGVGTQLWAEIPL
ncbi:MAG: PAS domain-containing sensor histidine kinase [Desulfobacteraceae bacterium]